MIRITTDIFCDKCGNWEHGGVSTKPQPGKARRSVAGKNSRGFCARQTPPGLLCPAKTAGAVVFYGYLSEERSDGT